MFQPGESRRHEPRCRVARLAPLDRVTLYSSVARVKTLKVRRQREKVSRREKKFLEEPLTARNDHRDTLLRLLLAKGAPCCGTFPLEPAAHTRCSRSPDSTAPIRWSEHISRLTTADTRSASRPDLRRCAELGAPHPFDPAASDRVSARSFHFDSLKVHIVEYRDPHLNRRLGKPRRRARGRCAC